MFVILRSGGGGIYHLICLSFLEVGEVGSEDELFDELIQHPDPICNDLMHIYGIGPREFTLLIVAKVSTYIILVVVGGVVCRMTYLMTLGLSGKDVAFMVRRFSPLLGYNIDEVLRPKVEFLVNTMEKPITDVVDYPRYFSYSLEKKIKPRFWVLKGRNVEFSLKDMLGKSDEDFAAQYMGARSMLVPPPLPINET
jgi:hypothetical protein